MLWIGPCYNILPDMVPFPFPTDDLRVLQYWAVLGSIALKMQVKVCLLRDGVKYI